MINISNVSKIYKNKILALNNINLKINNGEKIALIGSNGAGKTTFLKIIASFILPDKGKIYINNKESFKQFKEISIITSNERSFYYRLTLEENLIFFGMLNNITGKKLKNKVEEVLEKVNLLEQKKIKYMEASTGMKRKLNIARGLLKDSNIYLFDEPTIGIDIESKIKILKIINEIHSENKIILIATHDLLEIKQTKKIIAMKKGKIKTILKTSDFLKKNSNDEEKAILNLIR
ncbi:ATP-binding cassette domain-containing protein [Oceanotoga teriensis]|uniref:ATP-binding cassette domain-containing protein n=1 Tax=Oceanotoga teriensis TaxID=515440 RepID=UPI0027143184|nr:ATP-binding cassette domain-containing protein [Oceanotoga teriensis]MDO7976481.1 ATP-binding cassette domain-containing protein [Oceanotoga teriensis]